MEIRRVMVVADAPPSVSNLPITGSTPNSTHDGGSLWILDAQRSLV